MDELKAITELLEKQDDLKLVLVYGSFARNQVRPDSDIDIAVMAEKPLSFEEQSRLLGEILRITDRNVDLVDLHGVHPPLAQEILHDKIWIKWEQEYYYKFLKRIIFETEDFLPLKLQFQKNRVKSFIND